MPDIAAEAAELDYDGAFPSSSVAALRGAGLLAAPLAPDLGGAGWGLEPTAAQETAMALRLIGRASLPLGRLYEGHVNALRLVQRHGSRAAVRLVAEEAKEGLLFGVWNTEAPGEAPLVLEEGHVLRGRKILCSGAGHVARALVTARDPAELAAPPRMVVAPLAPGERADISPWTAQGMRASATGAVDFTGLALSEARLIGAPGDYARQPDFSGGAWRFAAVHCGGAEALLGHLRSHLRRTGRGADPHQAARLGTAALAVETARLWVEAAAARAETRRGADDPGEEAVAFVNLARLAVERAGLDVLELAARSVGLSAYMRPNPIERVARDLATYLRQPNPDGALAAAARHVLDAPGHPGDLWG